MPQQSRAQRRRQPVRSAQSVARQQPRRVVRTVEPIDYSRDYASVRHDLRRIALWAALLFLGMAALYFVL